MNTKEEILALRKFITDANTWYHEKGKPKVSDEEYDKAKDRLAEINPKDPIFKKIGSPVKKNKVSLPYFMGSLDKIYTDDVTKLRNWLKANKSSSYYITDKLDGISLLVGNNGKLFAYTRGNGSEGEDVSYLLPYIKGIPELNKGTTVRGELVISKADFRKFQKEFKNARNLVAGIKNFKGVHKAVKSARFIVHEVVSKNVPLFKVSSQLKNAGAEVVFLKKVTGAPSMESLARTLEERLKVSKYDLDGIVLSDGKGNSVAIKKVSDIATATIREIQWQVSRHGYLTPVAILETPILLSGAMVSKATAHNAKMVKDFGLGPGAIITITRSGEVIPKILSVLHRVKPQFPKKGTFEWVDETSIRSTSAADVDEIAVKRIVNFFTVLGIKDFKQSQITKLYEDGLTTIAKIIKAKEPRLVKAGLGSGQATKLVSAIAGGLAKATMPKMMVASGCFPRGFGLSTAKAIWDHVEDRAFTTSSKTLAFALKAISGIGDAAVDAFLAGRKDFIPFIADIEWKAAKKVKQGSRYAGKVFVFTGVRDAKVHEYLEANGGRVSTSVSKNTTHLIVKDKSVNTEKVRNAKALGIKIITIDEARKL